MTRKDGARAPGPPPGHRTSAYYHVSERVFAPGEVLTPGKARDEQHIVGEGGSNDHVFLAGTLDEAWLWAGLLIGPGTRVLHTYEVEPLGPVAVRDARFSGDVEVEHVTGSARVVRRAGSELIDPADHGYAGDRHDETAPGPTTGDDTMDEQPRLVPEGLPEGWELAKITYHTDAGTHRTEDQVSGEWTFAVRPGTDPAEALRAAAQDYYPSEEGRQRFGTEDYARNYGDVIDDVPADVLAEHGAVFVPGPPVRRETNVDLDDVLFDPDVDLDPGPVGGGVEL